MILTSAHRTWLLSIAFVMFLYQVPEISYLPKSIGFLIILGVGLSSILQNKTLPINLTAYGFWAILFTIYICVSLFWSEVVYDSLYWFLTYMTLPLILIGATYTPSEFIQIKLLSRIILMIGIMCGIGAVIQLIYNLGIYPNAANYPFYDPNSLAIFLGISSVIAFDMLHKSTEINQKIIITLLMLILFSGMMMTGGRGTILITLVTFLIQIIFFSRVSELKILGQNFIFYGLLIFSLITLPSFYEWTLSQNTLIDSLRLYSPLEGRLIIWNSVLQTIYSTNLFFGNGIGSFRHVYLEFRHQLDNTAGVHAHNDILHLWLEIGLIGLITVSLLGVLGFIKLIQTWFDKDSEKILPLSIIIFIVMASMMTTVIMLPSLVLIAGLCFTVFIKNSKEIITLKKYHASIIAVFFMILMGLNICVAADNYFMSKIRNAINQADIQSILKNIDNVENTSMSLNPSVPIFKISTLLALHDTNFIPLNKKENALKEIDIYINDAKRLNPHNPEILYYQGQLLLRHKNEKMSILSFEQALKKDPSYLAARIALIDLEGDKLRKTKLIEDGLNIQYWKQNPSKFYGVAMITAQQLNNPKMASKAKELLESYLRLK
jgi:O-antigen ligase